ncbi:MAG: nitroreductase family protein [Bacteroidota bacterium]
MLQALRTRVRTRLAQWAHRRALKNPRFGGLYFLLDGSFDREFSSVLHGRSAHASTAESPTSPARTDADAFTLRRNTHRIEKGLLMRPRRPVFALEYIEETVAAFATILPLETSDPDLILWAVDVLDEYFRVVDAVSPVDAAHETYRTARATFVRPDDPTRRIPYHRETAPLSIDIDELAALAHRRRSVRWFTDQAVPRDAIDRALEVALQSPSACNRQPYVFHIFDDPELVQAVGVIPMGTKGYAQNIPAIAVLVGRQRAYFNERDRHLIYIDGALAAMSFMYGLEVQGIASCPINWPDIANRETRMARLLGLATDERPVMLIAFGYPDPEGTVAFSQKKPLSKARTYNVAPGAS